jgi:hypothetical protein
MKYVSVQLLHLGDEDCALETTLCEKPLAKLADVLPLTGQPTDSYNY